MVALMGLALGISIVAAVVALESRNLYSSLISSGVGWLAFLIGLVLMRALGVALVPLLAAVLAVWLLVRAKAASGLKAPLAGGRDLLRHVVTLILLAVLFVVSFRALGGMPGLGEAPFASISGTPVVAYGSANFLTVLFSYRLLDAIGALAVIFAAALGAITLCCNSTTRGGE